MYSNKHINALRNNTHTQTHTQTRTYTLNIYKQQLNYAELHGSTRLYGRTLDTRTSYSLDLGFNVSAQRLALLI